MSAASLTKISSFCVPVSLNVCHGLLWPWSHEVAEHAGPQRRRASKPVSGTEDQRPEAILSEMWPPQGHRWGSGRWHRLSASGILGSFEVPAWDGSEKDLRQMRSKGMSLLGPLVCAALRLLNSDRPYGPMKGWSGGISNQARSTFQESLGFYFLGVSLFL